MKESRVCIKCSSRRVVKIPGKKSRSHAKFIYNAWGKSEVLDRYVCMNCGFTERYAQLSDKFRKWGDKELKRNPNDDFIDYV